MFRVSELIVTNSVCPVAPEEVGAYLSVGLEEGGWDVDGNHL